MTDKIIIKGAREHNLKNVSLELPRNKIVCFTGLSGSGKSSLAFDTIFAEGQRRYVESLSAYARQFLGQMKRPDVDDIEGLSPAISIDQKAHSRNPRSTVATITEVYDYLRVLYARIGQPHCVTCNKEIQKLTLDEMVDVIIDEAKGEATQIMGPVVRGRKGEYYQMLYDLYNSGFAKVRIDGKIHHLSQQIKLSRYKKHTIEVIIDTLTPEEMKTMNKATRQRVHEAVETALEHGGDIITTTFGKKREKLLSSKFSCPDDGFSFPEIEPRLFSFNSPYGACQGCDGIGAENLFSEAICTTCNGDRLRPEAMHVIIGGKNIAEVTALTIDEAYEFLMNLKLNKQHTKIAENVLREIKNRIKFMLDVGIEYLSLNRKAGTLSGGEAQRIRLASQVGSKLVGAMYVLDEPTIGLHQRDNEKLIATLKDLRDIGNTIIIVEHDEDTIRASDYMVEIGPGAGIHGGEIIAAGEMPGILENKDSLTAAYLRGDRKIEIPQNRRKIGRDFIKIKGACENNLKNINVDFPLRRFVCVTGVSGSGKSTLTEDIMYRGLAKKLTGKGGKVGKHSTILGAEYLDRIELIDQKPIGRTPRSNPATYTGAWTPIRELLAATEEARYRAYRPGRFSFNTPGGRCENCQGNGLIGIEMHFLPTVYVECDVCHGKRFDRETLEVEWNGKNVYQILQMTIDEGVDFFKDVPIVHDRFKAMQDVGLGYITVGQPATTLSGGEAQRVKLSKELAKKHLGRVMYVFDEPTTGLHFEDIKQLLEVMHRLVDKGNTVVVIEHNLDVIKTADWIIDLGPEGGHKGGTLLATGTPEEIARKPISFTGKYLKAVLKRG